ncbi:MAG TPA: cation:proton antiporter [Clostridia bacterium]|nr:cation:proton antiporter [Clostridia bacterium]HRX42344.1 cation:proton antiporter [Clostridia bacterium]
MAYGLALVIITGLTANWLFEKMKLPGLLGMLLTGIILGPWCLDLLSDEFLVISDDFRKIALIIILLRAGLGLRKDVLKKVGGAALRLSMIPCLLEGGMIMVMSIILLDFSIAEAGMLGFMIAAVSPAVVVPAMLEYQSKGIGGEKGIPTMILAGASVDDIFAITIFSAFLGIYAGNKINIFSMIGSTGLSIVLGIILGAATGFILTVIFRKMEIRDTKKVLLILGVAIAMTAAEDMLSSMVRISSLLGIMTVGFILLEKLPAVSERLALKFGKIWIFAEILLFVLIGAKVDIGVLFKSGIKGLLIIAIGLLLRAAGVLISLAGTNLLMRERLFCIIAYIPKATVQAAIGAVPLALGVKGGEIILAIAVLSIAITAPLGAIGIRTGARRLPEPGKV